LAAAPLPLSFCHRDEVFEHLTIAIGKVARDGPYRFIHITGDYTYASRRYELRDRLDGLPNEF